MPSTSNEEGGQWPPTRTWNVPIGRPWETPLKYLSSVRCLRTHWTWRNGAVWRIRPKTPCFRLKKWRWELLDDTFLGSNQTKMVRRAWPYFKTHPTSTQNLDLDLPTTGAVWKPQKIRSLFISKPQAKAAVVGGSRYNDPIRDSSLSSPSLFQLPLIKLQSLFLAADDTQLLLLGQTLQKSYQKEDPQHSLPHNPQKTTGKQASETSRPTSTLSNDLVLAKKHHPRGSTAHCSTSKSYLNPQKPIKQKTFSIQKLTSSKSSRTFKKWTPPKAGPL